MKRFSVRFRRWALVIWLLLDCGQHRRRAGSVTDLCNAQAKKTKYVGIYEKGGRSQVRPLPASTPAGLA
jgi:hypothetical protein